MRLVLKLSAAVMLAVAMQCLSLRFTGWLDEAQFAARALYGDLRKKEPDTPARIEAASRLMARHVARMEHQSSWSFFEPTPVWREPLVVPPAGAADSS